MFEEIICDHSLNGEPLPENLIVIGALNPKRPRLRQGCGLRDASVGLEDPMANLVYRVYPLPATMKEFIWNFGTLDDLDERQYIAEMLDLSLQDARVGLFEKVYPKISEITGNSYWNSARDKAFVDETFREVTIMFGNCLMEVTSFTTKHFPKYW